MPTYDYRCEKCENEFQMFQSMTDESEKKCPECEGKVKRLISSGAGIIFKGKGFYQTDYKSSGSQPKPDCGKSDTCSGTDTCGK
ncbi:MAG: zinc ribbon domain-containing protein [Candidatus Omnitrophica bacterium]|nr:zinc ribbon domain-containing protein [Candidatus Omnitrophota bacterium]